MRTIYLAIFFLHCIVVNTNAQNFFWSDRDIGEGVIDGDLIINPVFGETTRLFLYYSADGQDIYQGFDFEFSWETSGVVAFSGGQVLDFDITVSEFPFYHRWEFITAANILSDDAIIDLQTFVGVGGDTVGIDAQFITGSLFEDQGHDADADAFQVLSIDFIRIGHGVTQLQVDKNLVGDGGQKIQNTFSGLQIGIDGLAVGDVNLDGVINLLDAAPFSTLLATGGYQVEADVNYDGVIDLLDIAPFVDLIISN